MGYEYVEEPVVGAKIKVIGVGGGGGNALNCIAQAGIEGNVEYIAVNTDIQALHKSAAHTQIQIGEKLTHGLGAGAKPEIGEASAQESKDEIENAIKDADMVFITAGMGGGTGTGAAPVVAEIAQSLDKLTIAVVTKPFKFEGAKKMERAEKGIEALIKHVDALIVIPNQNLITNEMRLTMKQSYAIADEVLKTDVIAIAEIITRHDEINVDFADVTTILKGAGRAHIAIGHGEGKDKVQDIINQVISSDLLETSIKGARRLIVNVTMSEDLLISDMDELTAAIADAADDNVEIILVTVQILIPRTLWTLLLSLLTLLTEMTFLRLLHQRLRQHILQILLRRLTTQRLTLKRCTRLALRLLIIQIITTISSISSRTSNNAFKGGSAFTLSALFEPKSENIYIIKGIFVFSENYHDIENFSQKHLKSYGKFDIIIL